MLKKIKNNNVIKFINYFEIDKFGYLIVEYCN